MFPVVYQDVNNEEVELAGKKVAAVHAYCFCGDKLVLVYAEEKGIWTPPGGGVEAGEIVAEAVVREVQEESNMKVLRHKVIGFQEIAEPQGMVRQTRSVCIVEPYGEFVSDPDGDITEIAFVAVEDIKKYFDWGVIGDHILKEAVRYKKLWESEGI